MLSMLLRFLLLATLAVASHAESDEITKNRLLSRVANHTDIRLATLACSLDSDQDGVVTKKEAAFFMAQRLGKDGKQFYTLWDEWQCGRFPKPQTFQLVVTSIFAAVGRLDWIPCRMSAVSRRFDMYSDFSLWAENVTYDEMIEAGRLFMLSVPAIEKQTFQSQMDTNRDGCLSDDELDMHLETSEELPINGFHSEESVTPNLLQIDDYFGNSTSCIDATAWGVWSLHSVYDLAMEIVMATEERCAAQYGIEPEQEDLGMDEMNATIIIMVVLGSCCSISFAAFFCVVLCRHRRARMELDRSCQVQALLKAKIDTWTTLDVDLKAKASSLEPSFVQILELHCYKPDVFELSRIIHPEDTNTVRSLMDQLKSNPSPGSVPAMATVRLEVGAIGLPEKAYVQRYVRVELLVAWGCETSVLVGITLLEEIQLVRGAAPDEGFIEGVLQRARQDQQCESVADAASACSKREVVLNGSEVISFNESEVATFRSMEAIYHEGGQITRSTSELKCSAVRFAFEGPLQDPNWGGTDVNSSAEAQTSTGPEPSAEFSTSAASEPSTSAISSLCE
mmetsp:Transcript_74019/g.130792  ORF Transcript_74019/g.130792 Transcript_74019/m.130792 type:complete len:565 (-) Transcript_74019:171-1865(-)